MDEVRAMKEINEAWVPEAKVRGGNKKKGLYSHEYMLEMKRRRADISWNVGGTSEECNFFLKFRPHLVLNFDSRDYAAVCYISIGGFLVSVVYDVRAIKFNRKA